MQTRYIKLILGISLCSFPALAQEDYVSRESNDLQGTTMLSEEKVGIQPALGTLVYTDELGEVTSRMAAGLLVQWNLMNSFEPYANNWFMGPAIGAIYSHTGGGGANFFGVDPAAGVTDSGQVLLLPANLKFGYAFNGTTRLSLHAGANVLHRTRMQGVQVGEGVSTGSDGDWRVYPNVGADLEASLGGNTSLLVRPDATITQGNDAYTALVGISVAIR